MNLEQISYTGPEFDSDSRILNCLPQNLTSLLKQVNGFIQYDGGLHVRGVCKEPEWHSIEFAMNSSSAFHINYTDIANTDIPFAQDCVGDQFLLRKDMVFKLYSESGDIEDYGLDLFSFLDQAANNPVEFLGLHPLIQLHNEGNKLNFGELIHVYPPFCSNESKNGVSLRPLPSLEVLHYLADLSKTISGMSDGEKLKIIVKENES